MTKRQRADLRARLHAKELLVAPGVFDGISARIADQMGFEALYMTGYGTVASHLGLPDAGIATYSDMVGRVEVIAGGTMTPLIADGDTGYGGLLNVQYTVRGYEAAGAVAIQLEDQEFPKKCGHMLGRRVVPIEDMVDKVKVAVASRESSDFLIIARTDARTTLGLDEALRRADAYAKAGADILFVESPESIEEMRTIGRSFDRPLIANMVEGGRTPVLDRKDTGGDRIFDCDFSGVWFSRRRRRTAQRLQAAERERLQRWLQCAALQIQRVQRDDGVWRRLRIRQDLSALDAWQVRRSLKPLPAGTTPIRSASL